MAGGLRARLVSRREREAVLARLARDPLRDLLLIDAVAGIGRRAAPHELEPAIACVWDGGKPRGVASLRPSLVVESGCDDAALATLLPHLESVGAGLLKCGVREADQVWERLARSGHRALVDRTETAYAVREDEARLVPTPADVRVRAAAPADVDALVHAARASLREERRPDPFAGDPDGFRRWVRGRVERARVVEVGGRVAFVGYADVRRPEGWLVQGVYTWEDARRKGYAAAGMSALCREAFAAGAAHVQLAVIDGNEPAIRLYEKLGFRAFDALRTVLFARG